MIKAIETSYKNYKFRSRLEARWAMFFDTLGVRWEYEKEGYFVPGHGRYLPDFWLPDLNLWYEVKGEIYWFSEEKTYAHKGEVKHWTRHYSPQLDLALAFKDHQEWPVACAVGPVDKCQIFFYAWDYTDSSGGNYVDENARWCFSNGVATLDVNAGREDRIIVADNLMGPDLPWFTYPRDYGSDGIKVLRAMQAACSARFEHGERP